VIWLRGQLAEPGSRTCAPRTGKPAGSMSFTSPANVELRAQDAKETRTLRAEEIYYDVSRNVAVAIQADLEIKQPKLPRRGSLQGRRVVPALAHANSSRSARRCSPAGSPSDPGLKVVVAKSTLEMKDIPKRNDLR